jgi:tRNA A-37 threonylcarbamoyl transferase component Bud32
MDIENHQELIDYLTGAGHMAAGESPACRTLAGGVSNKTVRVERPDGRAWVIKQALPKLRTVADWFADPARVHREALGLRWLGQMLPPGSVPALIFEDETAHLLAMSAVPSPHENFKTLLLAGEISPDLIAQAATMLACLHRRGVELRNQLEPVFADRSFFESLRLEPYYLYAAQQQPAATAYLHQLVDATRARAISLVHGDFSPKNMLVHAGRLVLLDQEVIHFGDPAFDVGFFLTHLVGKAIHLPDRRGALIRCAVLFWDTYARCMGDSPLGDDLQAMCIRHTIGCMLARAVGRSPLEYLPNQQRDRLAAAAMAEMIWPAETVARLFERIEKCLS